MTTQTTTGTTTSNSYRKLSVDIVVKRAKYYGVPIITTCHMRGLSFKINTEFSPSFIFTQDVPGEGFEVCVWKIVDGEWKKTTIYGEWTLDKELENMLPTTSLGDVFEMENVTAFRRKVDTAWTMLGSMEYTSDTMIKVTSKYGMVKNLSANTQVIYK